MVEKKFNKKIIGAIGKEIGNNTNILKIFNAEDNKYYNIIMNILENDETTNKLLKKFIIDNAFLIAHYDKNNQNKEKHIIELFTEEERIEFKEIIKSILTHETFRETIIKDLKEKEKRQFIFDNI